MGREYTRRKCAYECVRARTGWVVRGGGAVRLVARVLDGGGGAKESAGIRPTTLPRKTHLHTPMQALALGASAVLVGRPVLYGLALGGQAGVERVLGLLVAELELAMALAGCARLGSIGPHLLRRVGGAAASVQQLPGGAAAGCCCCSSRCSVGEEGRSAAGGQGGGRGCCGGAAAAAAASCCCQQPAKALLQARL